MTPNARGLPGGRRQLIEQIELQVGITMHQHPRLPHTVVVSDSDCKRLYAASAAIHRTVAHRMVRVGLLVDDLTVMTAPDWACDPVQVAWLRLRVSLLDIPLRPVMRALNGLLTKGRPA
ncbi:hypothetical protein [Agrococcus casei]|uniref:Uncharacterized protein n=1 Tax=Agrococcus casei LMG 22410 TaxID=1255656 RepID=A0A1R4FGL6_9MICO|nr:hypothetical protein [Agrococcus casei]SJM55028.1 hypothetical protein CZ674_04435 [Agrococcus casei LMG 22410]